MNRFRIRFEQRGRFTHLRFFALRGTGRSEDKPTGDWQPIGMLVMRNAEFAAFRSEFDQLGTVEFLPEQWQALRDNQPIEATR